MERLKEEEENEEETGDDNVRFPAKGADYVVLPTSDQVTENSVIMRGYHSWILVQQIGKYENLGNTNYDGVIV